MTNKQLKKLIELQRNYYSTAESASRRLASAVYMHPNAEQLTWNYLFEWAAEVNESEDAANAIDAYLWTLSPMDAFYASKL